MAFLASPQVAAAGGSGPEGGPTSVSNVPLSGSISDYHPPTHPAHRCCPPHLNPRWRWGHRGSVCQPPTTRHYAHPSGGAASHGWEPPSQDWGAFPTLMAPEDGLRVPITQGLPRTLFNRPGGRFSGPGGTLSRCLWQESFVTFSPADDVCLTHRVTTQQCDLEPTLA